MQGLLYDSAIVWKCCVCESTVVGCSAVDSASDSNKRKELIVLEFKIRRAVSIYQAVLML